MITTLLLTEVFGASAVVTPNPSGPVVTTGSGVYVTNAIGRPKRDLVKRAYALCGIADYEFGLTAEEVGAGMNALESMMAEYPWSALGYAASEYGEGLPEEACGLEPWAFQAVSSYLAVNLAPEIGKTLTREAMMAGARSVRLVEARVAAIPSAPMQAGTIRGQGGERWNRDAFFPPDVIPVADDVSAGNLAGIAAGNV